jgi:hypothetical protein
MLILALEVGLGKLWQNAFSQPTETKPLMLEIDR